MTLMMNSDDQELEAHYMYMAQIQEVTPDAVDTSGPIFDVEPLHKVQNNNDNYNVFAIRNKHPEQPKSVNDIYLEKQSNTNITIDSLDICYDREQDDQDDTDELAQERDLLASLIKKLKCEIDYNKFLETSNKALVDKLKDNQLMFKDLKKFQAELDRYHDVNYASKVAIDCAKAKGDLMSYKIESKKSSNEYTRKINYLNQMISDMKKEFLAHQETISIMSQEKEAHIKFYKTREDKELDKVIALENKVKVLDDIVYKTGQSVQTMNMLNRNCKTSFSKPEFLKKAQRANPCLYDISCYNDNLALMLAPESYETIRLDKESRSKLSDLIRPFDYDQLNNLYDLHSQILTGNSKTQFLNEIDRLLMEYYYADHMNAILGVYTEIDEVSNLQCDYLETLEKYEHLEKELSKSRTMSNSFEAFQKHAINLELDLQRYLKAQLQDKGIAISELQKLIEKMKGKSVETKTRQPIDVLISTREPKQTVNQSVATSYMKIVAIDSTVKKSRNIIRKIYEQVSKTCSWWYRKFTPPGYKWKPKSQTGNVNPNVSMPLGNASRTANILEPMTPRCSTLSNTPLSSNSFAARKDNSIHHRIWGNDLLTGSGGTDLYSITLQDTSTPNPICLMAKVTSSQAWLWNRRLSHLNFDTINLLSKNNIVTGLPKLHHWVHDVFL
ncbi:integrase, catalytic region, zinc finger, CCHC-type containing protein [Tanacetum coccineum]